MVCILTSCLSYLRQFILALIIPPFWNSKPSAPQQPLHTQLFLFYLWTLSHLWAAAPGPGQKSLGTRPGSRAYTERKFPGTPERCGSQWGCQRRGSRPWPHWQCLQQQKKTHWQREIEPLSCTSQYHGMYWGEKQTKYLTYKVPFYGVERVYPSQTALMVKNLPANARDIRDAASIPGLGRFLVVGNGNPLQCSCLENPMDRGVWWATVHGVAKSWALFKRLGTQSRPRWFKKQVNYLIY